ncbi:ferritin-like domain-containing protein [Campylobacter sp.]|uniref:ferritin-like domain-containing protein n=1 Tax=Campylobacter sp. TaxID=205 RepID=UPI0026FF491E|nr:ferritin-like domain-containing protein [Campylobacter sp.]
MRFFKELGEILICGDKDRKIAEFKRFYNDYKAGLYEIVDDGKILELNEPSYAKFCQVVEMKNLDKKAIKQNKEVAFLHSIAHIEYSAIDIALDSAYRFRGLPKEYYDDWLEVADDEIRHFEMIERYMQNFGVRYGDMQVHNGLFVALKMTETSLLERMAVLPRYMEANGLDANAFMLKKLEKDDTKEPLHKILKVILDEEISHVSKGDRWFKFECEQTGTNPSDYISIVRKIYPNSFTQIRELNEKARLKSGFSRLELDEIKKIAENRAER